MSRTVEVSTYVNVDVDLGDIDTRDLIEELVSRKTGAIDMPENASEALDKLHLALKLGQDRQALDYARIFVRAHFGVCL